MSIAMLAINYKVASKKGTSKLGWKKPSEGFDVDSGSGSTGVVLRDAYGSCIATAQNSNKS
ncbi:hypothetical protein E2562_037958 [Oryza meyeriana var. granulata]|uniref:Uncharacterized protein n=1 Tax=Oryza meyeriana var. granulata TaxID=110450 RepID=A0A6G1CLT2_9ORYZ|nr:hypothetical protein E2562_037958 [Oryza meyeriana var. granulata]